MSVKARIDVDVLFHDVDGQTMTIGAATEHLLQSPGGAVAISGTVGTSAVSITGLTSISTLAIKNTGSGVLRLGGSIDVSPGRLAVIPTTTAPTVQAVSGSGTYSCVWVG